MSWLAVHAAATWFLVGLIWVVQLLHYPTLAWIESDRKLPVQRWHMRRITWIVAPTMIVELGTAVWLAVDPPVGVPAVQAGAGLALVLAIWLSTAVLQAPAHGRLAERFDARDHAFLVKSNWIRTALWTARGVLVLAWL